jgi:hypothetical protein
MKKFMGYVLHALGIASLLILWGWSIQITYHFCGGWGIFLGAILAFVGMILVAIIAALAHGAWMLLLKFVGLAILGCILLGWGQMTMIQSKSKADS